MIVVMAAPGCSHRAELRQELAVANDMLPQPIATDLTLTHVALKGHDAVFTFIAEEASWGLDGMGGEASLRQLETVVLTYWLGAANAGLRDRLDKAACHARFVIQTEAGKKTISFEIPCQERGAD